MANDNKQNQVQVLIDTIQGNNNFALIRFEKTLHISFEALRKELRASGSKIKIIKNSLFVKALNKIASKDKSFNNIKEKTSTIRENSAMLLLGEEWSNGLNAFHKFLKNEKTLSFKIGFLDKIVYGSSELEKIAQLPSKETLVGQIIGSMKAPIYKFNHSIKFNMQKFVYIISEKSKQAN